MLKNTFDFDAIISKWDVEGSSIIANKIDTEVSKSQNVKSTSKDAHYADAMLELNRILLNVCSASIRGSISSSQLCDTLKASTAVKFPHFGEAVADVLWLLGLEADYDSSSNEQSSEEWRRLCRLVSDFMEHKLVSESALKRVLELELLEECNLISNAKAMSKKLIRANTKNLYTQQKYNLLREETEGYSKLIHLLHAELTSKTVDQVSDSVKALIGFFDLDPNRVFDVILEAFEFNSNSLSYVVLVDLFRGSSLPHLLGFKFQFYQRPEQPQKTPRSLYIVTALLLAQGKLDLDAILAHMRPEESEIAIRYQQYVLEVKKRAKEFGVVNLGGSAPEDTLRQESDQQIGRFQEGSNDIFCLLEALMEVRCWKVAASLIERLEAAECGPLENNNVADSLCSLIQFVIGPVYQGIRGVCLWDPPNSQVVKHGRTEHVNCIGAATSLDDILYNATPLLQKLGAQIGRQVQLFTKVCRILVVMLTRDPTLWEDSIRGSLMQKVLVQCLLPGLCLIKCNPVATYELWLLLSKLPYQTRYNIYAEWKDVAQKHPLLLLAEAEAAHLTRKVLRRVSKENTKPIGRQLAKVAHSNPRVVFSTIVSQIEAYDNLIMPVVEALKYLSPLSQDMLSYMLVVHLASGRGKLKDDGTNTSQWLSSLSEFCGVVYRKYPTIELSGLLQYLAERLKAGHSLDLLVLNKLLARMGGCESFEDISEAQLEGQAGGPTLRSETVASLKVVNKRAVTRLRDALLNDGLVVPLLGLISQQRASILYSTDTRHLKLLGRLYDTCHMTLFQLCDFFGSTMDSRRFAALLPSISDLCLSYHMEPEIAFLVARPAIRAARELLLKDPAIIEAAGDNETLLSNWDPLSKNLLLSVKDILPNRVWECISPELFTMFWSLSLYDIHVPHKRYQTEVARLRQQYATLEKSQDPALSAAKRRKEVDKCLSTIQSLETEQGSQVNNRRSVKEALEKLKSILFPAPHRDSVLVLLQHCILPRAIMSPEDAVYSARMTHLLHDIGTPYFSCIQYFDKSITLVARTILCITEREAANLGLFLRDTLQLVNRWAKSKRDFDKECSGEDRPGFCVDYSDPKSAKVDYLQYSKVVMKWHIRLTVFFTANLGSSEYMDIRNSLIVLTKIVDEFPTTTRMMSELEVKVNKLREEEREDLKVMANRYWALLQKQKPYLRDDGVSQQKSATSTADTHTVSASGPPNVPHSSSANGRAVPSCSSSQGRGDSISRSHSGSQSAASQDLREARHDASHLRTRDIDRPSERERSLQRANGERPKSRSPAPRARSPHGTRNSPATQRGVDLPSRYDYPHGKHHRERDERGREGRQSREPTPSRERERSLAREEASRERHNAQGRNETIRNGSQPPPRESFAHRERDRGRDEFRPPAQKEDYSARERIRSRKELMEKDEVKDNRSSSDRLKENKDSSGKSVTGKPGLLPTPPLPQAEREPTPKERSRRNPSIRESGREPGPEDIADDSRRNSASRSLSILPTPPPLSSTASSERARESKLSPQTEKRDGSRGERNEGDKRGELKHGNNDRQSNREQMREMRESKEVETQRERGGDERDRNRRSELKTTSMARTVSLNRGDIRSDNKDSGRNDTRGDKRSSGKAAAHLQAVETLSNAPDKDSKGQTAGLVPRKRDRDALRHDSQSQDAPRPPLKRKREDWKELGTGGEEQPGNANRLPQNDTVSGSASLPQPHIAGSATPRNRSRKEVIEENRRRLEAEKLRRANERQKPSFDVRAAEPQKLRSGSGPQGRLESRGSSDSLQKEHSRIRDDRSRKGDDKSARKRE